MRKTLCTLTVMLAVVAVCAGGLLLAGEKPASGKVLYRTYCKPCHGPDSPHGQYAPLSLIQDQWDRFFDKKLVETHEGVQAPGDSGEKLLEVLDDEMLKKIRKFAVDHAADSESPMTCG